MMISPLITQFVEKCKNMERNGECKNISCDKCKYGRIKKMYELFDRSDLEVDEDSTEETTENEAHLSHDYNMPTECRACGGNDLSLRAIYHYDQKMLMLRYVCNECGHSDAIRTKKNQENTHNPSDGALRQWRKEVRKRYGLQCAICGSTNKPHAHHIIPIGNNWGDMFKYMPTNGIILCEDCHNKVHNRNKGGAKHGTYDQ